MTGDAFPEVLVGVPEDDDTEGDDPGSVHVLQLLDGIGHKARDTKLIQSSRGDLRHGNQDALELRSEVLELVGGGSPTGSTPRG